MTQIIVLLWMILLFVAIIAGAFVAFARESIRHLKDIARKPMGRHGPVK